MAFRKKVDCIISQRPDVLVVPECESLEKLKLLEWETQPTSSFWHGDNPNKGIGIFSFGEYKLNPLPFSPDNNRWIIPFIVSGPLEFTLVAMWSMNHRGNDTTDGVRPDFRSLKQLLPTLRENIVLMGDFNNSVIWDTKKKNGSFCDTIELLREKDISRCYHEHYNEEFGSEARPTIYWRKSKETTYHIDYCFCSQPLLDRLSSVQVGEFETTKQFSDHVPLTFTFDF